MSETVGARRLLAAVGATLAMAGIAACSSQAQSPTGPSVASGSTASRPSGPSVDNVVLPDPTITVDVSTCGHVTLSWDNTTGLAQTWQVQVSDTDATNFDPVLSFDNPNYATTTLTLALEPGTYLARVRAKSTEPHVNNSGFALVQFTVVACVNGCSPVGWIAPITHNPSVNQPATLPIKFCASSAFTGSHTEATGRLTLPNGSTRDILFTITDDGIFHYLFRTDGEALGNYLVEPPAGVGFAATASFSVH